MTRKGRTITADQVKLLVREGEGLTVEFKERYTPRIDEDIVAFDNARGGALLLGVRDLPAASRDAAQAGDGNIGVLTRQVPADRVVSAVPTPRYPPRPPETPPLIKTETVSRIISGLASAF